jgi:hypothetical protein
MRTLELLTGPGSVGDVFKEHDWGGRLVDRDLPANINCDVLDWDYENAYPPNHFDFIWASPPCTQQIIVWLRRRAPEGWRNPTGLAQRTL